MAQEEHICRRDYRCGTATGEVGDGLGPRTLEHLAASCPECAEVWERLGSILRRACLEQESRLFLAEPAPPDPLSVSSSPRKQAEMDRRLARIGRLRRRAKKQLSELRHTPRDARRRKVASAYRRFRSRFLAELLVEEARSVVRQEPLEAASFAGLVRPALKWTLVSPPQWAAALLARGAAHQANGLRIAGDLDAAGRAYEELWGTVSPLQLEPQVFAEVASLEASLRVAQHGYEAAERLLDDAALVYEYAGDVPGVARCQLQKANLLQLLDRPEEVAPLLQPFIPLLREHGGYPLACSVAAQVNALCDVDDAAAARWLLADHEEVFVEAGDHGRAALAGLEGRIALGMGEPGAAGRLFEEAVRSLLALDRHHDAALACLYLAEAYHLQGTRPKLVRLASQLVRVFHDRGLPVEAWAAIQQMARAITTQRLDRSLFDRLRRQVRRA